MSKVIKLKQSDIEKMVTNIVMENLESEPQNVEEVAQDGVELKLGLTQDGGYVLYKTNPDGSEEVVQQMDK